MIECEHSSNACGEKNFLSHVSCRLCRFTLQDMSEMQANLSKLRALKEDDKTENGLLRSRIDEQSQLIMILKKRTDEAVNHARTLEAMNEELRAFRFT